MAQKRWIRKTWLSLYCRTLVGSQFCRSNRPPISVAVWWSKVRGRETYVVVISKTKLDRASCLDYCNSVLYQINTTSTKTIQSVWHSAARLIMPKRKFVLITQTLRDDLHWLPVSERIVFKLCSIIFNLSRPQRGFTKKAYGAVFDTCGFYYLPHSYSI